MRVIYTCPFVPAEWIEAHGLTASRLVPSLVTSSVGPTPGVCPYAHAFACGAMADKDTVAVIVTTVCDQMRRAAELMAANAPVFLLNVPHTWQIPAAHRLYRSELERLGEFLVRLGGRKPSNELLAQVMVRHESVRRLQTEKQGLVSVKGIPLALVGGPLSADMFKMLGMIEQSGGQIVFDATETGERTLPAAFDRRTIHEDPLAALTDAYFGSIPDPFRRPNNEFYKWLGLKIQERGVRGIILHRYLWCDIWHAEAQRIKEWLGLPFLQLDVTDAGFETARTLSRLQAFLEVLR